MIANRLSLLLRNRIQEYLAGRVIDQLEAEELGAFAQRLEFTSAVELVVSSCTGVVIDEIAGEDAVDQHARACGR